jgi:hypothetical protein
MAIEYLRLTNVYTEVSNAAVQVPTAAWWILGIAVVALIFWTFKQ